jgi:hypothetical protein
MLGLPMDCFISKLILKYYEKYQILIKTPAYQEWSQRKFVWSGLPEDK